MVQSPSLSKVYLLPESAALHRLVVVLLQYSVLSHKLLFRFLLQDLLFMLVNPYGIMY